MPMSMVGPAPSAGYVPPMHADEAPPGRAPDGADALGNAVAPKALLQRLNVASALSARFMPLADPLAGADASPEAVADTVEAWHGRLQKRLADNHAMSRTLKATVTQSEGQRAVRTMTTDALQKCLDQRPELANSPTAMTPRSLTADSDQRSTSDFFDSLQDLIKLIGSDYLAIYEHLIERYSDMFDDFNKKVMARMSEWINGADDGKKVQFNGADFRTAVMSVINDYSRPPACVLFPVPETDGSLPQVSREDALNWAKAMGLPEGQVIRDVDGNYYVGMDLSPLRKVHDSMPHQSVTYDSAKFQAWQTGFNTQEAALKNYLQIATSKYSNANAYHDNFIKILSSQLSQFAEMLKAYLN